MSQKIIGIVIGIVVLAAGAYYWFALKPQQEENNLPQTPPITPLQKEEQEPEGLGGELYEKTQNPAERVPDTNPFQKTNPFSGKTNPFE